MSLKLEMQPHPPSTEELTNFNTLAELAWTLPLTEELLRIKLAPFCTLTLPSTELLFKVQVAPAGTVKFDTALLLIAPVQFAANPSCAAVKPHEMMMVFRKSFFIDTTL